MSRSTSLCSAFRACKRSGRRAGRVSEVSSLKSNSKFEHGTLYDALLLLIPQVDDKTCARWALRLHCFLGPVKI